jgi:phosphodiesterase/alkaline phosphatase D-like protein
MQETAGGEMKNKAYKVQFNYNSGGWTDVGAATVIQYAATTQYADQDATTQVIGDGSFVAGDGLDNSNLTGTITLLSQSTEIEICLQIDSAAATDGHTFQLRLYNSTDTAELDSYTNTPTITVNIPATLVGETQTLKYDIYNLIGETQTLKYDIYNLIGETQTLKYDIYNLIGETFTAKYDIIAFIGEQFTAKYDIYNLIGETFTAKYDIYNLIGEVQTLKYDIYNLIGEQFTAKYDILTSATLVGETFTAKYDIYNLIGETQTLKYDIYNFIGETQTLKYDIYNLIGETFTAKYDIYNLIGEVQTLKYDIFNLIGEQFTAKYDILGSATLIGETFRFVYSIAAQPAPPAPAPTLPQPDHSWLTATVYRYESGDLKAGPCLGAATQTSMRVWCALKDVGQTFKVEWWPYDAGTPVSSVISDPVEGNAYSSGIVELTGLSPGTRYGYQVTVNAWIYGPWDFFTVPDTDDADLELFCTSDFHGSTNEASSHFFVEWLNRHGENPNKFRAILSYGDMSYMYETAQYSGYDEIHSQQATVRRHVEQFMFDPHGSDFYNYQDANMFAIACRYTPWYNIWDDWDFLYDNSWGGSYPFGGKDAVKAKFLQAMPFPDFDADNGGGINHWFKVGNTLVIMLDGRYNKAHGPNTRWPAPVKNWDEGGSNSAVYERFLGLDHFGAKQISWMKRVIKEQEDTTEFLVLANGTTWCDNHAYLRDQPTDIVSGARDGLGSFFKHERNEILQWLDKSTKFKDVILLSGDEHNTVYWKLTAVDAREDLNVWDPSNYVASASKNDKNTHNNRLTYFSKLIGHEFKSTLGGGGAFLGYQSKSQYYDDPGDCLDEVPYLQKGLNTNDQLVYHNTSYGHQIISISGRDPSILKVTQYYQSTLNNPAYTFQPSVIEAVEIKATPTVEDDLVVSTDYEDSTRGEYPIEVLADDFEDGLKPGWSGNPPDKVSVQNNPVSGGDGSKSLRLHSTNLGGAGTTCIAWKEFYVKYPSELSWRIMFYNEGSPWNQFQLYLFDPDAITTIVWRVYSLYANYWEATGNLFVVKTGTWECRLNLLAPVSLGACYAYIDTLNLTLVGPYTEYT